MSIDYFIATSSVLETSPLPYADLQLVNVRRYCVPYDQLKFMNQRLSASAICEKVGPSKHTVALQAQPPRAEIDSQKTIKEKQATYVNGVLT